jgi:hypothetical protein
MSDVQRKAIAIGLAACAAVALLLSVPVGSPTPAPQPPNGLVLRGKFVGPSAADDAATLAGYADEIASEIEHDGMQSEPFLRTAAAFDELRTRTRALLCRGESIGDRQPRVREVLDKYLTEQLGTSGGPVGQEQRSKWVSCYREIGRAAADVSR